MTSVFAVSYGEVVGVYLREMFDLCQTCIRNSLVRKRIHVEHRYDIIVFVIICSFKIVLLKPDDLQKAFQISYNKPKFAVLYYKTLFKMN